jgi:glycosyltransferase involved in cell wall biosynthesis
LAEQVRPDALLFTPHYSSCARQARAVAGRLAIPFIVWPAIHLDHDDHTSAEAQRFYRSAERVLCLSRVEREWLVTNVGVPSERALMPGYPWRGPVHDPRPARAGMTTRLLSVGAFVSHKRFGDQIEAVQTLRRRYRIDARLTLAGAGPERTVLSNLQRISRRLGVEPHIEFAVDASDADIAKLYHDADAFLFTSRSESFGVSLLEAIARGTRPIVYPHAVYRALVEESGFGSVAAESTPDALAAAVACHVQTRTFDADALRAAWLATHSSVRVGALLAAMLERLEIERSVLRA